MDTFILNANDVKLLNPSPTSTHVKVVSDIEVRSRQLNYL